MGVKAEIGRLRRQLQTIRQVRPMAELLALAQAGRWADLTDGDLDRIIDLDGNGAKLRAMTDAELSAIVEGGA